MQEEGWVAAGEQPNAEELRPSTNREKTGRFRMTNERVRQIRIAELLA